MKTHIIGVKIIINLSQAWCMGNEFTKKRRVTQQVIFFFFKITKKTILKQDKQT